MWCTQGVRLATMFEQLVEKDERFEVAAKRYLGMVVFRLQVSTLIRVNQRELFPFQFLINVKNNNNNNNIACQIVNQCSIGSHED